MGYFSNYLLSYLNSLNAPFFIEMPVPSQESGWSYICVLGVPMLSLSTNVSLDFGTVPTVWYSFVFHFISHLKKESSLSENVVSIVALGPYQLSHTNPSSSGREQNHRIP